MKTIFASILLFFSGLFVSHPNHVNINTKPIPTVTPIATPTASLTQLPKQTYNYPVVSPTPASQYYNTAQSENDYYEYPTPKPTPTPRLIFPQDGNCTTIGDNTNCSDGTTYSTIGNITTGSNGTTITRIGNNTEINGEDNNASGSCSTIGNFTNCSDGSSSSTIGNTTNINNGDGSTQTCQTIGDTTTCN